MSTFNFCKKPINDKISTYSVLKLGMKLYAVGLVRAILPLLHHRLSKVRIAAIAAIQDLVKVPDRGKRKGAGTDAIVELVGFRAENVLPISVFYRADVSFNYLAQVR